MKRLASCGGHGTFEIRDVTCLLEQNGIPCCVVGVSALMFYGALRVRDKWEICVATEKVDEAADIIRQHEEYTQTNEKRYPQPMSFAHMYTWFRGTEVDYEFCLVPSLHARIPIDQVSVWRSSNGVPYAPLPDLVQSYLDKYDLVSLCDIVDGANLDYDWGITNLDLKGKTDVEWAHQRNAELMGGEGKLDISLAASVLPTCHVETMSMWRKVTEDKKERLLQVMLPHELFETRFMLKGSISEPWREERDGC
ncbi:hypothetical protein EJ05DRAFT_511314 [Pseudovirgaria hyperparasitica]|uniref:Uncharacterized protein n=1 Tax=Pseudovirgaria hyperparasitica TaxID=470096 RepID=A0A6A6W4N4_9PEZI|nr:uncharacterized protein EJ05DRAFT_511314 [Pseudovirgaria hyperparasitica]KAF2757515.1 hypothetical protein EJ05DRAFT_511314 [Pseudovirgaria hyperparasitica]